jgi:hypothetical protein
MGPQSETELFAWLFSLLGGVYSMLAQYEQQEEEREREQDLQRREEMFTRMERPHAEPTMDPREDAGF